ncbi:hypothetical protein [uncultured Roseovarius sp.]|uniref:hypothetical protein n=1 Tax=uncultured Roseovarius sp. TaxID=293344 RepID=UPI002620AFAB|nr:hypothetical protein [uncultured Roseovarius sp.]
MLQDLTSIQIYAIMALGAVFSLVGLWFIFRPPLVDGLTKIEIFGLKFNASSIGLVVFLVGAAFLTVPIFVPVRHEAAQNVPNPAPDEIQAETKEEPGTNSTGGSAAPPRPTADGKEAEPNDSWEQANVIEVGGAISGIVTQSSDDWYYIPLDSAQQTLNVKIRSRSNNYSCKINAFHANEAGIGFLDPFFPEENSVKTWGLRLDGQEGLVVQLISPVYSCSYDLFVEYG